MLEYYAAHFFAPASGSTLDLIVTHPPQIPTPADREWDDVQSLADDGGPDGWSILDRIILQAPDYLKPQGHLVPCGQKG